ncbi:amino acid adenylation domain-containing protein, partial [Streptosporangium sp. NPDC051023]|uniref:amino acid adenylation domain-containing protein n=1 Tax=Streptosporangium sp. NPDC051023 TaxID=3155410 RepID=UPI00344D7DA9
MRDNPDATALIEPHGRTLTYTQLNTAANQLARALHTRGVKPGDLVGLHTPRSANYIIALLAVLKAGAGYVPLETGLPDERLKLMATEPAITTVITAAPLTWTHTPTPHLSLDDDATFITSHDPTNLGIAANPEDIFYIPYTSGSTGKPKGTLVPHRAIPGFFTNTDYATWGPDATTLLHSALSWDGNLVEILPPLLTGGRVIIHPGPERDPLTVAETAHTTGVTHLFLPTAAFNTIMSSDPHLLTGIRYLMFGGEQVSPKHVHTALTSLPGTRLIHCYGPCECTVFTTTHHVTPADLQRPTIPIGTPIGDRRVHLIDPATGHETTTPGQIGEIHISGPSVAHGYLNRPTLTATHFLPNPHTTTQTGTGTGAPLYRTGDLATHTPDGHLLFHGRTDTQHKIRGYRIELTEIEIVLTSHPRITHAAVTTHPDPTGTPRLTAYLTTTPNHPQHTEHTKHTKNTKNTRDTEQAGQAGQAGDTPALTATDLRTHLQTHLPDYMIPTTYLHLPAMPLTHNGKINRKALPPPHTCTPLPTTAATPTTGHPATPLHHTLTHIW